MDFFCLKSQLVAGLKFLYEKFGPVTDDHDAHDELSKILSKSYESIIDKRWGTVKYA
jgi:hypothetical protein